MTRIRPVLLLLAGLLAVLLVGPVLIAPTSLPSAAAVPAAGADTPEPAALSVTLTSMEPAAIPKRGPITIAGVIRNTSEETWTNLHVYPLTSYQPMTDRAEVDSAARSDPDTTDFGQRLLDPGITVGDLPADASTTFQLKVRRHQLNISGAQGVYWIGVQVLGASTAGRDNLADGKARTFIPLVTVKKPAKISLIVPVRRQVRRTADGKISHAGQLAQALAPVGRLGRVLAFGQRSGTVPLTWLVDPAVLDAAQELADDNRGLDLGEASPGQEPSASPSPSSSVSPGTNGAAPAPELTDADRANAKNWLKAMTTLLQGGNTLSLPYGDVDVSSLAQHDASLLARAQTLSRTVFSAQRIPVTPAVAPPDGYLDPDAVADLGQGSSVVLADHGRPPAGPSVRTEAEVRFIYSDARTTAGGPLPEPRQTALSLRQRILADGALGAIARSKRTLVVALPADWDPGSDLTDGDFFGGLAQRWLSVVPLPQGQLVKPPLQFPPSALRAEVPAANVTTAAQLLHTSSVLGQLLDTQNNTDHVLTTAALSTVSYDAADGPVLARVRAGNLDRAMTTLMDGVRVVGTSFVTLSGGSGTLTVSIVNGLDQPIRVGLRAHTGNPRVHINPSGTISLAGGQRSTVRLHAKASAIGVHEVTLTPVTTDGDTVGTPLLFSLRTSQVGKVFWGILIGCGVLLVLLILRRIRQRMQSHRWRP